ncbi:MAG: hypothetical protein V3U80_07295 [Flavobacteriaceae bacterium]
MKNLKFYIIGLVFAVFALTSCENNDPIVGGENPLQSDAARSAMSELQTHFTDDGQLRSTNNPSNNILFDYCFDFEYPVTLSYNTGTTVTVGSFSDLVDILVAMTDTLYIDGIVFPFNVEVFDDASGTVVVQTIANEAEFNTLLDSCGFDDDDCVCTDQYAPVCVEIQGVNGGDAFTIEYSNFCEAECDGFTQADIVDCDYSDPSNSGDDCFVFNYPISLIGDDGVAVTATDEASFNAILYASNGFYDFVYPFDVTLEDGIVRSITSSSDFEALIQACIGVDPCNCTDVVDPVCVEVNGPAGNETIEFTNMCEAECAGFTQADVVDCDTANNCIENFTVTTGDCIDENSYTVTFDFTADGFTGDFELYTRNDVLFAVGSMSDLPVTHAMPLSGSLEDYIEVKLLNSTGSECEYETEWYPPNCTTPACWEFVYPVSFTQPGGATITVNDRASFDNDFNPQNDTMVYPFDVVVDGVTSTIDTPNGLFMVGGFDRMCD